VKVAETVVLDLRRPWRQMVEQQWRRWEERAAGPVTWAERWTADLTRRWLAHRLARRSPPPDRPLVVSVGNLVTGGTGKTPVVIQLGRDLSRRGIRGAVISRGYGSGLRGPIRVERDDDRAGDEARLMAAHLTGWAVIQARDRAAGLALAISQSPEVMVVILEDGHQSARVGRHLDVVILDRWRESGSQIRPEEGLTLPWGRHREGREGALRAAIWLVEAVGGPSQPYRGEAAGRPVPVVTFQRRLLLPTAWTNQQPGRYALVSGIAKPDRFEAACSHLVGRPPTLVARFDDHHRYRRRDVERLQRAASRLRVDLWLTTEKDWLKLGPQWHGDVGAAPVALSIEWGARKTLPDLIEERWRGSKEAS
jgi:tetraacyldisaccharide 4'-kinase